MLMMWAMFVLGGVFGLVVAKTLWLKPFSIDHFFARVFWIQAIRRPQLLTELGLLERWGFPFYAGRLNDFSTSFARRDAQQLAAELRVLQRFNRSGLDHARRLSAEVMTWYLEREEEGIAWLLHDYPVNQMDGQQTAVPDFLMTLHPLRAPRDAQAWLSRLGRLAGAYDQIIAGVRLRASRGVLPPRFVFERVIAELRSFIHPAPSSNALAAHFADALSRMESLQPATRETLVGRAVKTLTDHVYPAIERVVSCLEELRSGADDRDGVWKLPRGDEYYAFCLKRSTTSSYSADEVHAIGLEQVSSLTARMREILAAQGYDTADLPATLDRLSAEERFLYPETDEGRARILEDYRTIIKDASSRLPDLFGRLPRGGVTVERVPEFRQAGACGAYYQPPALDGSRPGTFFANLRSVREIPRFSMKTLAYHEAVPGHHMQIALAQEMEGLPIIRRILHFTAYIEGWALYAERLADEQGFHRDPFDRLGYLMAQMMRAVRLVVDTGLHARRWTRQEAIDYMKRNTGMPLGDVTAEIERYIVWPGQACAYMIGMLKILDLREEARRRLGGRFDLSTFHDLILAGGALPLEILSGRVERWIVEQGAA